MGVNRLSIGLQSAHEGELRLLGRAHSVSDFKTVFSDARKAGFDNISADLMYGIPNQTKESFRGSLEFLCNLSPEHISAYGLKIEEGTPFHQMQNELVLPNEDEEYEMYLLLIECLAERGYGQYEISNFARPHRESRHNLRYWLGKEYLGFGVAAHSYFDGKRFGNSRDLSAFLRGEEIVCECAAVTPEEENREYVMLRLRLAQGLSLSEFTRRFGQPIETLCPDVNSLLRAGYLQMRGDFLSFTPQGFFVSNTILSTLLSAI
jgi:oxygen-independent coproporphyrinogen-3 oxidase